MVSKTVHYVSSKQNGPTAPATTKAKAGPASTLRNYYAPSNNVTNISTEENEQANKRKLPHWMSADVADNKQSQTKKFKKFSGGLFG